MSLSIGNTANRLQGMNTPEYSASATAMPGGRFLPEYSASAAAMPGGRFLPEYSASAAAMPGGGAYFEGAVNRARADESCGGHRAHRHGHHRAEGKMKKAKNESSSEVKELISLVRELIGALTQMMQANQTQQVTPTSLGATATPALDETPVETTAETEQKDEEDDSADTTTTPAANPSMASLFGSQQPATTNTTQKLTTPASVQKTGDK